MKATLKVKTACLVIFIACFLSVVTGLVSYNVYKETMDQQYRDMTMKLARTEGVAVDTEKVAVVANKTMEIFREQVAKYGGTDAINNLTEDELLEYYSAFDEVYDMDEYRDIIAIQSKLVEENQASDVYMCYMDYDTRSGVYFADPMDDGIVGKFDPIEDINFERAKQGIYDFQAYITNYPEYGWLCTAGAAIKDGAGNIVATAYVDIDMNEVVKDRMRFFTKLTILLFVLIVVATILSIMLTDKVLVKPIRALASFTDSFVEMGYVGSKDAGAELMIKSSDEIGLLYNSVQKMGVDIRDYMDNLTRVTAEKERIGAELDVATKIQADMLPRIFPPFPDRKEFDIFANMDPAKEVGGDFYDFFMVDDDHIALVMADVSGKGVPAALFMVIAKTLIKNRTLMGGSPSEILAYVNDQLCEGNESGFFVTVWLAIIQISTGKGVASNAGHENPVIRRKGGSYEMIVNRHSPAVAAMEGMVFRENEFELMPGDRIFVYTDGVPEATDANDELFGTDRMLEGLNSRPNANLQEMLQGITDDINAFVKDAPQFDDCTMLGFDYYGV